MIFKTVTKWDLISPEERESLERTPCNLVCGVCGAEHKTEADFAKHYIVPNPQHKNLGYCPQNPKGSLGWWI